MSNTEAKKDTISVADLAAMAGEFEAVSSWIPITQERIDKFAEATDDFQFIHVDPKAAAETAFGGTIAHGFLTLSLMSKMAYEVLPKIRNARLGLNYGTDKIRFLAPVHSGSRIRGLFRLSECELRKENELLSKYNVTVEIEGEDKPALIAEWYNVVVLHDEETPPSGKSVQ